MVNLIDSLKSFLSGAGFVIILISLSPQRETCKRTVACNLPVISGQLLC